ncbi:MAG: 2,3-diaminopropionate biosynthesis protein SbnA [Candidatus Poribacteria bacterium]
MVCDSILNAIGDTPLIRVNRLDTGSATLYLKFEALNPAGSLKDRSALAIIEEAERKGQLRKGDTIIESSSGNFAIALALIGAVKGYRVICVVEPKITKANRAIIESLGAEIVMVDVMDENGGYLLNRLKTVRKLLKSIPNSFWPNQYANLANPAAHFRGTGREIIRDTGGNVDYLIAPVSTGGTLTGTARAIKRKVPTAKVVAVDAQGSAIFSEKPHPRYLQGIGSSINPPNLDRNLIDEIFLVTDEEAFTTARLLARREGILAGGSSGAVTYVALKIAKKAEPQTVIVAILADRGERYLDTIFCDDWMRSHGFPVEPCSNQ